MKIAFFSESYKPYISGVVRSIEVLKNELENFGHEVFLFAPWYPGYKDTEKNIIRLPSIPTKYPGFRAAIPYPNFIRNLGYDIIHSNSLFQLGFFAMRYAKNKHIPFIYSFHTLFTEYLHYAPIPKKIGITFASKYIKYFCSNCNRIIVPTAFTEKYLRNFGVNSRIEIIPTGINIELSDKASCQGLKEKYNIPRLSKVLIYSGRLAKEKNIDFILKSFKLVLSSFQDVYLLLVGSGPESENYKKLSADLGIQNKIVFTGQIKYPEILNYYKCADMLVFASKTETQGLVIAEALSCGIPSVAIDSGGVSESIRNGFTGFLTKEDSMAFAEKILFLLRNDDIRKKFGAQSSLFARDAFSSMSIAKKIENIYNSLLYSYERSKQ